MGETALEKGKQSEPDIDRIVLLKSKLLYTMKTYVIKKGDRYWKHNDLGYTYNLHEAKLFTKAEALEIISRPNSDKTMHKTRNKLQIT